MNANTDIAYATSPKDITALARAIINHADGQVVGHSTYLKSMLAGLQIELHGKPVLRKLRGTHKRPDVDAALQAFEKINATYYEAVLAAIPEGLTAQERQSKTSFARSASATLRRAVSLGWDPLTPLPEVSKGVLRAHSLKHAEPVKLTPARAEKQLVGHVEAIADILKRLPKEEAERLREAALAELGVAAPQRLRSVSLRREPPAEIRPH